jgi:hypothetical protein
MRRIRTIVLSFAVVIVGGVAHAGLLQHQPVVLASDHFSGSVGDVRASSDSSSLVGCGVYGGSGPSLFNPNDPSDQSYVYCYANDASGASKFCLSGDPNLVAAVNGITSISELDVWFDSKGQCTQIYVEHASSFTPMTP